MKVNVRNNNVDKAVSIFKKKTLEVVKEVRAREFYEKPSDARRRNKKIAIVKERKRQANDKHPV
jgi:small subunit ribosomal protein S21